MQPQNLPEKMQKISHFFLIVPIISINGSFCMVLVFILQIICSFYCKETILQLFYSSKCKRYKGLLKYRSHGSTWYERSVWTNILKDLCQQFVLQVLINYSSILLHSGRMQKRFWYITSLLQLIDRMRTIWYSSYI